MCVGRQCRVKGEWFDTVLPLAAAMLWWITLYIYRDIDLYIWAMHRIKTQKHSDRQTHTQILTMKTYR